MASTITAIGSMLGITIYVLAIFTITLLRENDPWHWRNLHHAMLTLFRCDAGGLDRRHVDRHVRLRQVRVRRRWHGEAVRPQGSRLFVGFIVLGSNIILSPIIGVLTMNMFIGELKLTMLDLGGGLSEDTEELHFGLHGAGHAISFEQVRVLMLEMDKDGTGEMGYVELVEFMIMVNAKVAREGRVPTSGDTNTRQYAPWWRRCSGLA